MADTEAKKKWDLKEIGIAVLAAVLAISVIINIVAIIKMKKAESNVPEVTPIADPVEVEVTPEITLTANLIAEK